MDSSNKNLVLGLDIGTSSIKLVILNIKTNEIVAEYIESTIFSRINKENKTFDEQNVDLIINKIFEMFNKITADLLENLKGIQLCGQMHGIVLWNKKTKKHSNLITWQDKRCSKEFLDNLPIRSFSEIKSGYGCATLFWFEENPSFKDCNFSEFNASGTIHDYITFLLTKKCIMSTHNALSWGFFDFKTNSWQKDLMGYKNFPSYLLPAVKNPGEIVGDFTYINERKINTKVFNGLGDLQCSVFSCLEFETDCVINISTSAQVCLSVTFEKYEEIKSKLPKSVNMLPYFENRVLLVAASLNGGNVLDFFIDTILNWNLELDIDIRDKRDLIWKKLIDLATNSTCSHNLNCVPTVFGERYLLNSFGSLSNIRNDNFSIGTVFDSICKGIIKNLSEMITYDLLINELCCKRIVATGSAITRNPILKRNLESEFSFLEVIYKNSSDAALGSALFLKKLFK